MTLPLVNPSRQYEKRPSALKTAVKKACVLERERDEKGKDARPLVSFMPPVDTEHSGLLDLASGSAWRNHIIWRAGIIEGIAAGSLNFLSGLMVATLSTWPRAAVPAGILIGNTVLVSILVSATASASGAHISSLVTMSTAFCRTCHPVRAIIYIFCQVVGGTIGGALLRAALGKRLANEIRNASCWIDPEGEVGAWQAASIEFTCAFVILFLAYGIGLDPHQAELFGAKYGPVLVGLTVGLITSVTSTIHVGYTGAGMFPGRCFGLAAGFGEFQKSHWVWWLPDILAAAVHGLFYLAIPPYMKPYPTQIRIELGGA